jgi:polysaccharide pyruvyl transferase WcaK-like protein
MRNQHFLLVLLQHCKALIAAGGFVLYFCQGRLKRIPMLHFILADLFKTISR